MTTNTDALKLALEALSKSDDFLFDWHENESDNEADAYATARHLNEKAITAILEALAEQPAPVAEPHKQQEPKFWYDEEEGLLHDHFGDVPLGCIPLYTSPPAAPASQEEIQRLSALVRAQQITIEKLESQRQWVGLSTDEIYDMYNEPRSDAEMVEFARAIEAKLKEKNA